MIYTLGEHALRAEGWYYIAPSARVMGRVHLGADVSVWFNAVLRGDLDPIAIGEGSNIQDGSVLHTDPGAPLRVGRGCTVGHMAMLHGCSIGDNCLLGIGATVLNQACIAENTLVAARSLVTEGKRFPPGVLLMGSPAKVVRDLSVEEISGIRANAERYVANARRFAEELQLDPRPAPGR